MYLGTGLCHLVAKVPLEGSLGQGFCLLISSLLLLAFCPFLGVCPLLPAKTFLKRLLQPFSGAILFELLLLVFFCQSCTSVFSPLLTLFGHKCWYSEGSGLLGALARRQWHVSVACCVSGAQRERRSCLSVDVALHHGWQCER